MSGTILDALRETPEAPCDTCSTAPDCAVELRACRDFANYCERADRQDSQLAISKHAGLGRREPTRGIYRALFAE